MLLVKTDDGWKQSHMACLFSSPTEVLETPIWRCRAEGCQGSVGLGNDEQALKEARRD